MLVYWKQTFSEKLINGWVNENGGEAINKVMHISMKSVMVGDVLKWPAQLGRKR